MLIIQIWILPSGRLGRRREWFKITRALENPKHHRDFCPYRECLDHCGARLRSRTHAFAFAGFVDRGAGRLQTGTGRTRQTAIGGQRNPVVAVKSSARPRPRPSSKAHLDGRIATQGLHIFPFRFGEFRFARDNERWLLRPIPNTLARPKFARWISASGRDCNAQIPGPVGVSSYLPRAGQPA